MDRLLTLQEAAEMLRLPRAESFSRVARCLGIRLIRLGHRTVRVMESEVQRALEHEFGKPPETDAAPSQGEPRE